LDSVLLIKIEAQINSKDFYRANRQIIIAREAIISASQHFQRKLKLELKPSPEEDVLVSKSKATVFKKWLENIE
jgi:DNA-binding LytR/AlgR family response regulator